MDQLMNICTTVAQQPGEAHKQMALALEAVKIRNEHGFDFSDVDSLCVDGKNPLFESARAGNIPLVKLFLSSGADINTVDSTGVTPLYYAMANHHSSHRMVKFLLDSNADPNVYNHGKCPLLASFYRMKIDSSILLMKKGADVNNVILPSFCFVESVFALNSSLVMIASGVRFNLEEFDQLIFLSADIIYAGLHPRTFYLHGQRFFREGFTAKEMSALWSFQCLCMAAGFRVDQRSLKETITSLQLAIPSITDSAHQQCLNQHLEKLHVMDNIMATPLSLTRLCRTSIRSHLANQVLRPAKHLNEKISTLPVPEICINFLQLKTL